MCRFRRAARANPSRGRAWTSTTRRAAYAQVHSISKNAMGKVNKRQLKVEVAGLWAGPSAQPTTVSDVLHQTLSGDAGHDDADADDVVRPNR